MPSSLHTSLICENIKKMLPAFLSQELDIELHGRIEGHLCACDDCSIAYFELAKLTYEAESTPISEVPQFPEELPEPFISAFPENMKVIQLPLRYAASTDKEEKDDEFWQLVQDEFTITISQPKGEDKAVVGVNIANDIREKYEGKHIIVACDDKKTLLLEGVIVDGHLSEDSTKTFTEIMKKFPLFWGFDD